jgi:C4-dicarboxylate-specific signal transduction histidine kinase
MAAGIAHEVNNPLTILQGFASIIEQLTHQEPLDKENIRLLSGKLVHTTERISKIVKSLKSLSRNGDNDPFERVSIQTVIKEALDICGHRFKQNNIELKLPELDKDVFVKGREVQLGQVVLNLLVNAFDAVSGSDNGDKWVEVKLDSLHQGVSIDIIDSGPGVSIENAKKIMEPFFTTKDVGQGTGLGLSISKNIIEEHGGELFLIQNSKATTFRIQLPLV